MSFPRRRESRPIFRTSESPVWIPAGMTSRKERYHARLSPIPSRIRSLYKRANGQKADSMAETTHFGEKTVPLEAKQGMVNDVFHAVADRYDLMNDLMSGGVHRLWKDAMVARL